MRRLAGALAEAARTRSKKAKVERLAAALREVADDPEGRPHLAFAARFLEGRVGAALERKGVGAGWVLVAEAAARALGATREELAARGSRLGDLGDAVGELAAELGAAHPGLPLARAARLVDALEDTSSRAAKEALVEEALRAAAPVEARFLVKALLGEARTGAALGLILEAVAAAFGASPAEVRRAYGAMPDVGELAARAAAGSLGALRAEIGRPIGFMLASPSEELEPPSAWYVEDKLDGVRAQLHVAEGGAARVFARGGDDVTGSFPELAARPELPPCVLDGEILAVHPDGRPRPFGALQTRLNRKARADAPDVEVRFVAFDLLVLGAAPLLERPLSERRAALERLPFAPPTALLPSTLAPALDAAAVDAAYEAARARGHEGLVLKRPDAPYEPGRRGRAWCKVKRALATLDVVVTAAERGHGKRAGWLSDVTFAVWSSPEGVLFDGAEPRALLDVGKAYTGLTDAEIREMTERLRALATGSRGRALVVRPEIVLEVAFDGLQRSDRHPSGFALRFPRIVRERTDKRPEEANTLRDVARLFEAQVGSGHREEPPPAPPEGRARHRRRDVPEGQLGLFAEDVVPGRRRT